MGPAISSFLLLSEYTLCAKNMCTRKVTTACATVSTSLGAR